MNSDTSATGQDKNVEELSGMPEMKINTSPFFSKGYTYIGTTRLHGQERESSKRII
jgi:hypothetical protein